MLVLVGHSPWEAFIFFDRGFGLRTKANTAIGLAFVALIGMAWLSVRENRKLLEADRWVEHTHEVLEESASLRAHLSDAGIARWLVIQGNESQVSAFRVAERASLTNLTSLRASTEDNLNQQKRLDELAPIVDARLAVMEKSVAIHASVKNDEALQKDLTNQSALLVRQFVEQSHEFDNAEKSLLAERSDWAAKSVRTTSRIGFVLVFFAFGFIALAAVALNRELVRRKQAELELGTQKSLLQSILDTSTDAMVVADRSGKVVLRNPAAIRLFGETQSRISEDTPKILGLYKSDEATLFSREDMPLWRALNGNNVENLEVCVRPSGETPTHWLLASSGPLRASSETSTGGVVFYRDISDRKLLEKKLEKYAADLEHSNRELQIAQAALERVALVDELTGLQNRRGFLTLATQSIRLVRRSHKPFVLVFIDLDGLKHINDTLGHEEGNNAIKDAAMVLQDTFRHSDVLCRLGGDEFAVLMVDADSSTANTVRQRLVDKIERVNATEGRPYQLSLSLGMIACEWSETSSLEALLAKADALMYEDKKRKATARTFNSSQVRSQIKANTRLSPSDRSSFKSEESDPRGLPTKIH
jgi:diguanylate cyclase (GGDEF)-like protein/PAS domain S-box-containing protein